MAIVGTGNIITSKLDNGYRMTTTIEDDKRLFKLYKKLGLDVFENNKKIKRESTESND